MSPIRVENPRITFTVQDKVSLRVEVTQNKETSEILIDGGPEGGYVTQGDTAKLFSPIKADSFPLGLGDKVKIGDTTVAGV